MAILCFGEVMFALQKYVDIFTYYLFNKGLNIFNCICRRP